MKLKDLVLKNRSYRRFYEEEKVGRADLEELIEMATMTPSAANIQPLKYLLSVEKESNNDIFPLLKWAGYLTDWDGPKEGERPAAYIVILKDKELFKPFAAPDLGIVSQTILLGAVEKGFGGCIFGSVDREKLMKKFAIADKYEIALVIALGKAKEEIVVEDCVAGDIKYYRDLKQVHHVPKRNFSDLILN